MSDEIKEYSDIYDEYLDQMIRLAFELDDLNQTRQILEKTENDSSGADEETLQRIWQTAQAKMDRFETERKRRERRISFRQTAHRVLKAAACLLLALCVTVPAVLAASAEFRSRVIELLISIDRKNEVAYFDFAENPDASFAVPTGWTGEYFPSYIPAGMAAVRCDPCTAAEFRDAADSGSAGRSVVFEELAEGGETAAGLANAVLTYADVNGATTAVAEEAAENGDSGTVYAVWSNGEKMFGLTCRGIPAEEALKIAGSVRKIIR